MALKRGADMGVGGRVMQPAGRTSPHNLQAYVRYINRAQYWANPLWVVARWCSWQWDTPEKQPDATYFVRGSYAYVYIHRRFDVPTGCTTILNLLRREMEKINIDRQRHECVMESVRESYENA